jgi:hypothetical protein
LMLQIANAFFKLYADTKRESENEGMGHANNIQTR